MYLSGNRFRGYRVSGYGRKNFESINKDNPANGATRFVHPKTGQSFVIDYTTKELLQVGALGYKY
jgi:hypothetical protein